MRASIPEPRDHDLSRNQELDVQPTEPPRRPPLKKKFFFNLFERERERERERENEWGEGQRERENLKQTLH